MRIAVPIAIVITFTPRLGTRKINGGCKFSGLGHV